MPFCTLNAAFAVASATFVGGAVVAARSGADAESALGRWRRARDEKRAAEARGETRAGAGANRDGRRARGRARDGGLDNAKRD